MPGCSSIRRPSSTYRSARVAWGASTSRARRFSRSIVPLPRRRSTRSLHSDDRLGPRMVDLHTHILPGIDDGVRTLAESVELARAAAAEGVSVLAATPHVREDFPTSADDVERLVGEVSRAVAAAAIPIGIRAGAEVALDRLPLLPDGELRRLGLGGNPRYLLVEFPY